MRKKWKQRLAALLVMTLVSFSLAFSVPEKAEAASQGIDVSAWQGEINWSAVAQSGVEFAFIRVGSLSKGLDKYFYQNIAGAQSVGIKTGVYIYSYAQTLEQVVMEAQFVLAALQNISVSYPVVYDIEDSSQAHLPPETLASFANTFCAIMEQNGYYPMVYANTNWFTKKLGPIHYDKWVAQWNNKLDVPDAAIWQYSSTGKVPGIKGDVDRDLAIKDYNSMFTHTGFVNRNGKIYFLSNYRVYKGLLDLGTEKYYFDEQGQMYTGFLPFGNSGFFFHPDGKMAIGFTPIGDKIYCFGADGLMLTGLQTIAGQTYLFEPTGAMYTGFLPSNDGITYFEADGHMVKGICNIAGKLYYFDEKTGIMKTGLQTIGGQKFFFGQDGSQYFGWFSDGLNKMYFDLTDGHMTTGITNIDGATYYFDQNGLMQTGIVNVNGAYFFFDADGKFVPDVIIDPSMVQ